jgi:ubiquinone/menaquinone biosynthesis C-methylase UbiE
MDDSAAQRETSYSAHVGDIGALFSDAASLLARQLDLHPQLVLDVGCGSGVWSLSIAAKSPQIKVTGLDFPKVLQAFLKRAKSSGLENQIETLPGDMYTVELPRERFDLIVIANVLRLESSDHAKKLVTRYASVLRPGGSLLIVDALAAGTSEKDLLRAVYTLLLGVRTTIGRVHPLAQIRSWMTDAGLRDLKDIDLGNQAGALGAVIGQRPT